MKKSVTNSMRFFFLVFLMLTLSFAAFAAEKGVIKVIPAPTYPYGLTYDGANLWVGTSSSNTGGDYLWKLDPQDGTVLGTIPVPEPNVSSYTIKGLAFDGQYLWVFEDLPSSNHPDKIYKVDPANGNVLKTINSPVNNYVGGITYENGHIWLSNYYGTTPEGILIEIDTTGVQGGTITTEGEQPMGVAFDGQFIWCVEDSGYGNTRDEIYQYDPATSSYTGTFIRNPSASPRDMTWDGSYLWMINYYGNEIYQIALGGGTPSIELITSSIDFGLVTVGETDSAYCLLTNTGTDTLELTGVDFDNPHFAAEPLNFPVKVVAGASYDFKVYFTPSTVSIVNGNMTIHSNDPNNPEVTAGLTGQGQLAAATIALTATSHNFGNIWIPGDGTSSWKFGIINQGMQNLEISDLMVNLPVFWVDSPTIPFNVLPSDTVEVTVWFSPAEAIAYLDTLYISNNDPTNPVAKISLAGAGQSGPFDIGYEFWHYYVPDNPATSYNEYRPLALKSIDDVNGDGNADVVIASRNYWTICLNGAGASMTDEVWRFSSYISSYSAGGIGNTNDLPPQQKALAIANDLNGDGVQDVVIGTGGGNEHVYALDGTDGNILWQFGTDNPDSFGLGDITSVEVNEDFNGDQVNDVIASGSATDDGAGGRRSVYCFDGTNGQKLWQYFLGCFIRSTVTIGDVNGNGHIDVVSGTGNGVSNSYSIVALESQGPGGNPTPIWSFPIGSGAGGGKEVLRYDVPNETADVIAGAYFGYVYRLDGESGLMVWQLDLSSAAVTQLAIIDDVDGDGLNDILVASFAQYFSCVSGADGSMIWSKYMGNFTYSTSAIPDVSGDGHEDVLVACRSDILYALDGMDGTSLLEYPMNSGTLQGATLTSFMPDMDNNGSYEILGASDDGKIVALSGGVNANVSVNNSSRPALPQEFALGQNYPNPFNPTTTVDISLPVKSDLTLSIFDILGRKIRTYALHDAAPGVHSVVWDGRDESGVFVPSGVYFYRAKAANQTLTRRMLLLK